MLCRLCLIDCDDLLEIFDTAGERMQIRSIVAQHFGFQLVVDDQISDKICQTCWLEVENFHAFYEDVKRAQNMLKVELANNSDPDPDTDEEDEEQNDSFNSSDDADEDEIDDSDQSPIQKSSNCDGNYLSAICDDRSNITGDIDVFAAPSRTGSKILSGPSMKYKGYSDYISKANNSIIVVNTASSKRKNLRADNSSKFWSSQYENNNSNRSQDEFIRDRVKSLGIAGLNEILDRNELSITAFPNAGTDKVSKQSEAELSKYIQLNCELCSEKFNIFSDLKRHFRSVHKIIGYVVCCSEKLFNRSQLVNHVMKHLDRSRFISNSLSNEISEREDWKQCPICRQRFEKTLLSRHLREHFRGKSAQCEKCGLWCKSRYILQKHMQSHVDDCNSLACTICEKTFLSDVALQRHLTNVHYKERKFQCTMCNKAFKWSINLKEHMAIHTGERLYSCRYCSRKFNASSNLHSHRKKIHREEWEEERKKRLEMAAND